MKTISQLRKEAQAAPKFKLVAWHEELQTYVFIADNYKVKESMTTNPSKAALFSYGFDDENIKAKAWSLSTGLDFIDIAA